MNIPSPTPAELARLTREVRALCLQMVHHAQVGHSGADLSSADILCALYGGVLRVDAANPSDPARDRFILSKSHASAALYSVLSRRGFLPKEELRTFGAPGSRLCTAVSNRLTGVEMSTGALGHGLPFAVGAAIAARIVGSSRRIYVMTGDGELQEGSNWEAAMLAGTRGLDNLTLVVDRNRVQKGASTEEICALEPLEDKWRAFGWGVREVDGHDAWAVREALLAAPFVASRPSCLVANTVKGKGVSFMENHLAWHSRKLTDEDLARALDEIWGNDRDGITL
jgi:transketolase